MPAWRGGGRRSSACSSTGASTPCPPGYYNGKPVAGIGEWIMNRGKIPMAEYQAYAKEFNPVKFDADAWVKTAKDAGMKYIVITTKHHDGFAMFQTQASPWNIVRRHALQARPAQGTGRGLPASRASGSASTTRRRRTGTTAARPRAANGTRRRNTAWTITSTRSPCRRCASCSTNYGKDIPAVLWWDTPIDMNKERADKIRQAVVQALQPDLILNNRLGGGYKGDTETPEQYIPPQGYPGTRLGNVHDDERHLGLQDATTTTGSPPRP